MASVNNHEERINKVYSKFTPPFECSLSDKVKLCTVTMPSNSSATIHINCTAGYNATAKQAGSNVDIYIRSSNQPSNSEIGINVVSTKNGYLSDVGYTNDGNNKFTIYCNVETYASGIIISAEHTHSIEWHLQKVDAHPNSIIKNNTIEYSKLWKEGDTITNAVWNDYAELYPRGEETEPGDIIMLDLYSDKEQYIKATESSNTIIGVHSDTFGHLIGGEKPENGEDFVEYNLKKYIPVGLVGRVNCKVMGKISKGDRVVVSNIKGVGRMYNPKTDNIFQIVGMAVEDKNYEEIGRIKINFRGI